MCAHVGSKRKMMNMLLVVVVVVVIGGGITSTNADIDKDREQCGEQLVGLASCLPYVGGGKSAAKAPTMDCCTGLKQVLHKSKICLCILVKDRNDPKLGLDINATLALALPDRCNSPANVHDCPSLLNLAPGSPDAKVFEDYSNTTTAKGTIATSPDGKGNATSRSDGGSSSAAVKNSSGRGKKWLGVEMALGLLIVVSSHIFSIVY